MRRISTPQEEAYVGLKFIQREGRDACAPLVIFVHGRAGTRQVMWFFEQCLPNGASIVAFEAFLPDPLGGFSWWDFETPESKKDQIARAAKQLSLAIERFITLGSLTPSKVIALGFSQGAVLLSSAMLSGDIALDGLGVLAGLVPKPDGPTYIHDKPQIFIAHGIKDEVIQVERARLGVELLRELGLHVTYIEEGVGHKVGIDGTRGLKHWVFKLLGEPIYR